MSTNGPFTFNTTRSVTRNTVSPCVTRLGFLLLGSDDGTGARRFSPSLSHRLLSWLLILKMPTMRGRSNHNRKDSSLEGPEGKSGNPKNAATHQALRKQRDPRTGVRSVTTLSASQLERKRANDREAQRIIRQRTKDHIENLERKVAELDGRQEQLNKVLEHNTELERQIADLRQQLSEMQEAQDRQLQQSPGTSIYCQTGLSLPQTQSAILHATSLTEQGQSMTFESRQFEVSGRQSHDLVQVAPTAATPNRPSFSFPLQMPPQAWVQYGITPSPSGGSVASTDCFDDPERRYMGGDNILQSAVSAPPMSMYGRQQLPQQSRQPRPSQPLLTSMSYPPYHHTPS